MICHFGHNISSNVIHISISRDGYARSSEYAIGPWCFSFFYENFAAKYPELSDEKPKYWTGRCIKTDDNIIEPDEYCPTCIKIYNIIHGPSSGMWNKIPNKRCSDGLGGQCDKGASEGQRCCN